jgi:hypothetical protein
MHHSLYSGEADACRTQAALFSSKPEAKFLLRVADAFDELANRRSTLDSTGGQAFGSQMHLSECVHWVESRTSG